ncbi:MAG: PAS domain S-box protein [Desulfomonile tiedjei]|uniref:histidine kinase n=1 Tax=Desulfomonile tiedjei TaxID=2358 RepID=A0A9D6V8C7_9BACT|nr:PAS domain S-box protein [Desulfomonile tiedjei]
MVTEVVEASDEYLKDRHEKLFETLLETIPSSVLLIDRDMRIVSANRNFLQKSRRRRSEAIGRKLGELLPAAIIEYMDISSRVRQVFENGRATRGERLVYRAPGIPMTIYYYSILPFSWRGHVENAVLLMEDVTEQVRLSEEVRRAERHLASVVESATDLVLSTDADGRVLTWNTAAERLSGYTLDDVQKTLFLDWCVPEHRQELSDVFNRFRSGSSSQTGEWDMVTNPGKRVPISWVFSPMKDETGRLVGMVAVGRDLSEHRKLERELRQSQKLAALGVMAGGIAHEVRNPLAICYSAAQFLNECEFESEFNRECVERILANIQKASVIIENLLRFARPSAATDMTLVDIVTICHDTLKLVDNQAKIQKISICVSVDVQHALVRGNASLLQQVFLNLFLNAMNAMPDGGTLSLFMHKSGEELFVSITDTGHGIPKDDIDNIFDPFYTRAPVGKGTGLGLSICYSILKQHSGSLQAESVHGKGSTFTVRLPVVED